MKIGKIEFRNFSSYGNKLHQITFDDEGSFWLIKGDNGSGKSTISDVIKYAIYGKLEGKRLSDIPNRFNESAWVKITIMSDTNVEIVIERGITPTFLRVWVGGVEFDAAHKKDIQEYIEETLIQMPFYIFNNIISLSINDFKSFITLNAANKRLIFDKIFGLGILTQMKTDIKQTIRDIKSDIDVLSGEYDVLVRTLQTSNDELDKLNKTLTESLEDEIKGMKLEVKTLSENVITINEKLAAATKKKEELSTAYEESYDKISEIKTLLREVDKTAELYENDKCPMCESDLDGDFHTHTKEENEKNKIKYEGQIPPIEKRVGIIRENQTKVRALEIQISNKLATTKTKIGDINREISAQNIDKTTTEQTKALTNIIDDTTTEKENVIKKQGNIGKKQTFLNILDEAFGDKGIKQLAIQKIVPSLNADIDVVLKEMNIEHTLHFDKNFDVKIKHFGHEVSTHMLSTGEKKKLDFAIIIALIKVLKTRFSGLNLLFLDEIFSSIDESGRYQILYILSKLTEKLNINIFVINHSQLPTELFHHQIDVEKLDNFSKMEIIDLN